MRLAYCTGIRSLGLLDEDDEPHDDDSHQQHEEEDLEALVLPDEAHGTGERRGDGGEDEQRHAVADAALGDQLGEPHDETGTGRLWS